jgi:hypothetical protein
LAVIFFASDSASASSVATQRFSDAASGAVANLSDLRSAYLIRAGVVRYEAAASAASLTAQLQRHFDAVISLLSASTRQSIEISLARLQSADTHTWTAAEQLEWRQRLLDMRYLQLRRLVYYRDRAMFPQNEGQANHAVPIFVDAHDTACAVGQLMRWSGWSDYVAAIQHTNNLVYVPDATRSAVAEWVLTSGLTLEEAALIQPAYGLYTPFLTGDYEPGESAFLQNGLKYSNFHIESQNYTRSTAVDFHTAVDLPSVFLTPTLNGPHAATNVGINAGTGAIQGLYAPSGPPYSLDPIGSHWLVLGGQSTLTHDYSGFARLLNGASPSPFVQRINISFDVSTLGGNTFFNQIATHSYPQFNGLYTFNGDPALGEYEITTSVAPLGSVHFEEPDVVNFDSQSASANLLAPVTALSVKTTIWLNNGASAGSIVFGFNVVPEPTTGVMLVCCFLIATFALRHCGCRT